MKYGRNATELKEQLDKKSLFHYVGTSDSGAVFYLEEMLQLTNGNFRIAIINRDRAEVEKELLENLGANSSSNDEIKRGLDRTESGLKLLIDRYNPMVVEYNDLNKIDVIEALHEHCTPVSRFDVERYNMLDEMKIEPYWPKYLNNINTENIKMFLGG
jgi:hypothetical protein